MYAAAAPGVYSAGDESSSWAAELHLGFSPRGGKTLLSERSHRGPLTVQRPFYPEGGVCHVYWLHPPGGIVAGDRLHLDVNAKSGAHALLTTPAAGKFYRSAGARARQSVTLNIGAGAALEWLPQETIVYQGASLTSTVDIELNGDARLLAWEILALGRPAAGEGFDAGEAELRWRIRRDGVPLYLETMRLDAAAFAARWGLGGRSVCATMFATPATTRQRDAVRDLIGETPARSVTLIDDLLICRAADRQAEPVRRFFAAVRAAVREDVVGLANHEPRIWAT